MKVQNKYLGYLFGTLSFLLVLLLMPIGHAIMVLIEVLLHQYKMMGAGVLGFLGFGLLYWGFLKNHNYTWATVLGFLAGVLVWTGWIEFSFVWIAEKNKVSPQIINGEIATKPEYLIMLSSFGLLATIVVFYIFVRSNCLFFIWFQKLIGIKSQMASQASFQKSRAVITFIETIVIIWFFYVALLLLYDEQILGEKHWFTYVFAYGSLLWSVYLIIQLMKIKTFDYSLRYAIPTVIIFWNFVEIVGRWGLLEEIWIQPLTYKLEITLFFITCILLVFILLFNAKFQKTKLNNL